MRVRWPASLAGRITLLLLGGLMLLHIGSMWVHERALRDTEQGARIERMADQLAAARAAVAPLPEAARDAAAHAISRPGLDIHWDRVAPLPEAAPPEALAAAATRLGPGARIGWDPKAEPGHRVLGALPAVGGGWIVFSAPWLGAGGGALDHGAIASMVAMALGIGLVSILVVRWITGPLRRLASAADRIGRDPSPRPVATEGPEEVRHAAAAFNAMQDRIARLLEDRTEALAAMSHDLRTPLSRLQLRVGFLPEGEDRARLEADIAEMESMIARTLDYIREGRDAEPVRPADLAAILQTLASDAADAGHDVVYEGPGRAVLPLRRVAAKRALSNLVENALRHGRPPVRLRIIEEGPMLVVEVSDAGDGIAEADRARAMAPFVQLDRARGGSGVGLGLAIAQRFAQASQGRLELGESRAGGLLARLLLPRQGG
ncbi:HAMP domain-containing protein [Roseomonas sp. PWR1]|uniref:histidine kinase n=1 Tax=Roseomonas nitratireducens TaxID=2820810 RepID=A0ABS4ARC6_9PROT|nr:ATP-binding protein [Neoroseomonas nitratireducens]MBP0463908.1 HAMP domain-containing protein [Neoroseomonas nitratireducens]